MAGPRTSILSNALAALKLKSVEAGAPGSGAPFEVTEETIAFLTEIKESDKRIVVTDGGEVVVQ